VDDPIHLLLKKLLATEDLVEFDAISLELKTKLHERIEALREQAKGLRSDPAESHARRKRTKDGGNNP